jgi:LysM repeat protein
MKVTKKEEKNLNFYFGRKIKNMNKKDLIIFTIILNALLLTLLFVTSVKKTEEIKQPIATFPALNLEKKGVYSEFIPMPPLASTPKVEPVPSLPAPHTTKIEEKKKWTPKVGPKQETPLFYTVKEGDNPWTIAKKNNIPLATLLKINQLNEEKARRLKPGDRLKIR